MSSDRYTRFVLTVIAVCLVWICIRDVPLVTPAYAASEGCCDGVMRVQIVGVQKDHRNRYGWSPLPIAR